MNRQFSKDEIQMVNKCVKKVNFTHHQRNEVQNNTEIPSHHSQNGSHQKSQQQVLVRCERQGALIPCWWEGKPRRPLYKPVWKLPQKLKQVYPMTLP